MTSEAEIRRVALSLPGAYERASYDGAPSFRTKPRMFAWIRDDPRALVLHVASIEDKESLIAAGPEVYFTTAHYDGYPAVLARIEAITDAEMTEMITESYRLRAPKTLVRELDER